MEASGAVTWNELSGGAILPIARWEMLGELARLVRYRELRGGAVQLSGEGTYRWDRGGICHGGQGAGRGRDLGGPTVRLEKINGGYCLFAGPRALQRLFDFCHGAGRHGTRNVGLHNICGKEPVGQMELEVTGVELEQALRAFSNEHAAAGEVAAGRFDGGLAAM